MKWIVQRKHLVIGLSIGLAAGYAYFYFIGCASGTCAITSRPLNSSLYGGLMGLLISDILKKKSYE